MRCQRAVQTKETETGLQIKAAIASHPLLATRPPVHPILQLQRQIGNRAVTQLIQAKLRVGQPGDVLEHEADRVAETVMRMPDPAVQQEEEEEGIQTQSLAAQVSPLVQRQTEEEEEALQAKEVSGETPEVTPALEARLQSARGGGQSLLESSQSFFEPRFGYDFSSVRVHSDSQADSAARELNAQAFTIGQDIFFGAGRYQPHTTPGRHLLAHELTHVVQQTGGAQTKLLLNQPTVQRQCSACEAEEKIQRSLDLSTTAEPIVQGSWSDEEQEQNTDELEDKSTSVLAQINAIRQQLAEHEVVYLTDNEVASLNHYCARIRQTLPDSVELPNITANTEAVTYTAAVGTLPIAVPLIEELLVALAGVIATLTVGQLLLVLAIIAAFIAFIVLLFSDKTRRYTPPKPVTPEAPPKEDQQEGSENKKQPEDKKQPDLFDPVPQPQKRACVIPGSVNLPSGTLQAVPEIFGDVTRIVSHFTMGMTFADDSSGCACECGEYEQRLIGWAAIDWGFGMKPVFHNCFGNSGVINGWPEDLARDESGTCQAYGHRANPELHDDRFLLPDRATGCLYKGLDTPNVVIEIRGMKTYTAKKALFRYQFVGYPVDGCHGRTSLGYQHKWIVEGKYP